MLKIHCNFIEKETLTQVFFGKFFKISKNTELQSTSGWLLLLLLVVSTYFIPIISLISVLSSILEESLLQENSKLKLNIMLIGLIWTVQGSHLQMFFKTGVLKNFVNFTCWSIFFTTLQAWRPVRHAWIPFLQNTSGGCLPTVLVWSFMIANANLDWFRSDTL